MNNILLGKRIREERLKLNLTQEKLAEDIDISTAYMGLVERGARSLALDTLVRLANRLGVTVDYLLSDSVQIKDQAVFNELTQLLHNRNTDDKRMILDLVKLTLTHLDKRRSR